MTDEKKNLLARLSLALPTLGVMVALLTQAAGPATWVFDHAGILLAREAVRASLEAGVAGLLLAGWLPHILPAAIPKGWAKGLTRFACFAVAGMGYIWLMNPENAVEKNSAIFLGFLVGLSTVTIWTTISGSLYTLFPRLKPGSLE